MKLQQCIFFYISFHTSVCQDLPFNLSKQCTLQQRFPCKIIIKLSVDHGFFTCARVKFLIKSANRWNLFNIYKILATAALSSQAVQWPPNRLSLVKKANRHVLPCPILHIVHEELITTQQHSPCFVLGNVASCVRRWKRLRLSSSTDSYH